MHSTTTPAANASRREIGDEAVWTLSSAKTGNGVEQIRDDNTNTFWQSDGAQPHLINIQFMKKTRIQVQLDLTAGTRHISGFQERLILHSEQTFDSRRQSFTGSKGGSVSRLEGTFRMVYCTVAHEASEW